MVRAIANAVAKGLFDAAVFTAVKADDRQPSTGLEQGWGDGEQPFEIAGLSIDQHAKRLKCPRGGVQLGTGGALQHEIARFADNRGQSLGRQNRVFAAALDDQRRNFWSIGFIAEFQHGLDQFLARQAVDEDRRRLSARGIHAHVERAGTSIGKSAGGVVDLRAGDAEICENSVNLFDAQLRHDFREGREIRMSQVEGGARRVDFFNCRAGELDMPRIKVATDERSTGRYSLEKQ